MLKLYADESVDNESSFMNVSGFLMTEDQFIALNNAVQEARGDLPYFHMKEGHYFKHPQVYEKMLRLVNKESVMCGVSASLYVSEHVAMTRIQSNGRPLHYWMGKPYTYLLGVVMSACAEWLTKYRPSDDFIAYVFENGHANQGDATAFWSQLSDRRNERLKNFYRYESNCFVDGKGPLGSVLQLADIFAWHLNKSQREKTPLGDVAKTFGVPLITFHHGPEEMFDTISKQLVVWQERSVERHIRNQRRIAKQTN